MKRGAFLPAITALLLLLAPGCEKQAGTAPPTAADQAITHRAAASKPTRTAPGLDKHLNQKATKATSVGVAECDEYLAKYERCIRENVPESERAGMNKSLAKMRTEWKQAALSAEGKRGLATACSTALHSASQAMATYECQW